MKMKLNRNYNLPQTEVCVCRACDASINNKVDSIPFLDFNRSTGFWIEIERKDMQFNFEKYQFFVGILQIQMKFSDFPFAPGLKLELKNQLATRDSFFLPQRSFFSVCFLMMFRAIFVTRIRIYKYSVYTLCMAYELAYMDIMHLCTLALR